MIFQYLGTAAAEGWPAIFCNCEFCLEAAKRGGRDIRTRSQAIINDDLLIDLPPDTYMHKLQQGLDLSRVRYLLITHKHMDHFYPQELTVRGSGYSHNMVSEDMDIYLADEARELYKKINWESDAETEEHLHFHIIKAFETFQAGPYTITPLPARHMGEGNEPFVYFIEDEEGKTVLYLHDTGYFPDSVWDFLAELEKPADMVSFDACFGPRETVRGGHMGFPEIAEVMMRMREIRAIDDHTVCIANHYSHNCYALYDDLVPMAAEKGLLVSYDGMKLTI